MEEQALREGIEAMQASHSASVLMSQARVGLTQEALAGGWS